MRNRDIARFAALAAIGWALPEIARTPAGTRLHIALSVLRGAPVAYKLTLKDGAIYFPNPAKDRPWWNRPSRWVYGCTFTWTRPLTLGHQMEATI